MFTIIYPIINQFYGQKTDISDIMKSNIYTSLDSSYKDMSNELIKTTNMNIINNYKEQIKSDIILYFQEKQYEVKDISIQTENDNNEEYGKIKNITVTISKNEDIDNVKKINNIEEIKIQFNNNVAEYNNIDDIDTKEFKDYVNSNYKVNKENIIIIVE